MMPDAFLTQCWDSGLFISFLTKKEPEKVDKVRELISLFDRGEIQVTISTAVIAEIRPYMEPIAKADKIAGSRVARHDIVQEAVIDAMLDNDSLDIRPVTPMIAKLAAEVGSPSPQATEHHGREEKEVWCLAYAHRCSILRVMRG